MRIYQYVLFPFLLSLQLIYSLISVPLQIQMILSTNSFSLKTGYICNTSSCFYYSSSLLEVSPRSLSARLDIQDKTIINKAQYHCLLNKTPVLTNVKSLQLCCLVVYQRTIVNKTLIQPITTYWWYLSKIRSAAMVTVVSLLKCRYCKIPDNISLTNGVVGGIPTALDLGTLLRLL